MEPAIVKGFEMGTHTVPIAFDNPLCWTFWGLLLLGYCVQVLLQRKRNLRFLWPVFLLAALTGCEVACQIIIGWDLVLWVILHFYVLTLLAGAVSAMLLRRLRRGKTR